MKNQVEWKISNSPIMYDFAILEMQNRILNISSTEKISKLKEKLKKEMNSAIKKDKIFKDEDKLLIKKLIKKVILELELNQIN